MVNSQKPSSNELKEEVNNRVKKLNDIKTGFDKISQFISLIRDLERKFQSPEAKQRDLELSAYNHFKAILIQILQVVQKSPSEENKTLALVVLPSLTRVMMESYQSYSYWNPEECGNNEDFRKLYHDFCLLKPNLQILQYALNLSTEEKIKKKKQEIEEQETKIEEIYQKLKNEKYFKDNESLRETKEKENHLKAGTAWQKKGWRFNFAKKAQYKPEENDKNEINYWHEKCKVNEKYYKFCYSLCSEFIHVPPTCIGISEAKEDKASMFIIIFLDIVIAFSLLFLNDLLDEIISEHNMRNSTLPWKDQISSLARELVSRSKVVKKQVLELDKDHPEIRKIESQK